MSSHQALSQPISVQTTDSELLQTWMHGDSHAGNQLVRRYEPHLYRFFARKVDIHDVHELIQQCWEAISRTCARGQQLTSPIRVSFRAYLFGIARKRLFAYYHRQQRDGNFEPEVTPFAELAPALSSILARQAREQLVIEALHRIPINAQILLELHYLFDLKYIEIAGLYNIPIGTTKSRIRKAKQLLTKAMEALRLQRTPLRSYTLKRGVEEL